jgi:hypothetical protein
MTSITIWDLRHKWPQARLVRVDPAEKTARKRFNPAEHAQWQKQVFGEKTMRLVDRHDCRGP